MILYIMLCGYPPFNGSCWEQILAKVKKGKFSLSLKGWENVSYDAKHLIKRMLEYGPEKRISAEEAFNDKWIQNYGKAVTSEPLAVKSTLSNLQLFKVQSIFQQLAMAFIANRLQDEDEQKKLLSEFTRLDANGDGILQKEELMVAYVKLGKTPLEAKIIVEEIMNEIDTNNSGAIDFSEFLTANLTQQGLITEQNLHEAFKLFDKV